MPFGFAYCFLFGTLFLFVGFSQFRKLFGDAGCKKLGFCLLALWSYAGIPLFIVVVSFLSAVPATNIRGAGDDIPADWSAGVMNHGKYYQWYTIEQRPVLFWLSVVGLVVSVVPLQILTLYCFLFGKRKRPAGDGEQGSGEDVTDSN